MNTLLQITIIFNIVSFIGYGTSCLFSAQMKTEFQRYRLPGQERLTGIVQIVASLVMLLGYYNPLFFQLSAMTFIIMMAVAVLVRLRIKDALFRMLPALVYLAANMFIFFRV